jgi:hypothetical protein
MRASLAERLVWPAARHGKVLIEKRDKRKAQQDGEGLLTPLVQNASEAIAAAVAES